MSVSCYVTANLAKHTTCNKIEHRVRSICPFACLQICQRSRVVTYNVGSRNLSFDFFDKSTNLYLLMPKLNINRYTLHRVSSCKCDSVDVILKRFSFEIFPPFQPPLRCRQRRTRSSCCTAATVPAPSSGPSICTNSSPSCRSTKENSGMRQAISISPSQYNVAFYIGFTHWICMVFSECDICPSRT